ncbi:SPOR domain-containing protein [Pseudomaricurvus sp.]|uniref:SPOR domain-containing protein n=1 Tax=Pseudomaricurvus sp. TaxID=2004510 RepID=UPI003F6ACE95
MTRDFAKKTRSPASGKRGSGNSRSGSSRSGGSRSSKTRNSRSNSKPKSQVPGWVWLFTGTVLGAFIMFLAYLAGIAPQQSNPQPMAVEAQPEQTKPQVPKPRFDFYQLLKESEVEVKQPSKAQREAAEQQAEKQEYILQVGSFRKDSDADRLRAQLILLNLDAQVEKVTVRSGETWYRVLVGPYSDHSKMERARSILASNRINALLLKRKKG